MPILVHVLACCMHAHFTFLHSEKKKFNLSIENDTVLTRKTWWHFDVWRECVADVLSKGNQVKGTNTCALNWTIWAHKASTLEANRVQVTDKLLYDSTHRDYMATKQSKTIELQKDHLANFYSLDSCYCAYILYQYWWQPLKSELKYIKKKNADPLLFFFRANCNILSPVKADAHALKPC